MINEEILNKRAKKSLIILFVCGLLLIAADLAITNIQNSVKIISNEEGMFLIRPDEDADTGHIRLQASVSNNDADLTKNMDLSIKAYSPEIEEEGTIREEKSSAKEKVSSEELLGYELRTIESSFNDDTTLKEIKLPSTLSNGEKIQWRVMRNTNTAAIIICLIFSAFMIYKNRLNPLKKLRMSREESITRQLPEFINRIVLLLNAGLVLNQAFISSTSYNSTITKEDYFYIRMRDISSRINETNSSMISEFKDFANECRSLNTDIAKELMRISNIFCDNISKGVELTDKLQCESETLWLNRKKDCEERGRIAETKQTLPLTLFLLVLIVITVSPALLEL